MTLLYNTTVKFLCNTCIAVRHRMRKRQWNLRYIHPCSNQFLFHFRVPGDKVVSKLKLLKLSIQRLDIWTTC